MRAVAIACLLFGCGRFGFDQRVGGDAPMNRDGAADGARDGSGAMSALAFMQASPMDAEAGSVTPVLSAPSQPGSLLLAGIVTNVPGSLQLPAGWAVGVQTTGGSCTALIAYHVDVAGGTTAVQFVAGSPTTGQLTEWRGVDPAMPFEVTGGASAGPVTAQSAQTTGAASTGDAALAVFCEDANFPVYTAGSGWTTLGAFAQGPANPTYTGEYVLGVPAGVVVANETATVAGKYAAVIAALKSQ